MDAPSYRQRIKLVAEQDRLARERYGLPDKHPIRRRLASLETYWDPFVFSRVQRALEHLEAVRSRMHRIGERVPPPDAFEGRLVLGSAPTPHEEATDVAPDPNRLILGTLATGLIGTGKTHLIRLIAALVCTLLPHVRVMIFDPNRSYLSLCADTRFWSTVDWRDLRLNPFCAPVGYPYALWRAETLQVLFGEELLHSRYFLEHRLDDLFKERGVPDVDDGTCHPPSLEDLRDNLESHPCKPGSKFEQYRQSALNLVDGRLRTTPGVYSSCSRGMEFLLARSRVRVSTEGLSPVESYRALVTHLIHYSFRQRSIEPIEDPPQTRALLLVEESQTLLANREGSAIALYQEMLLRSRALGLGYIFVTQHISRIDPIVLAAISNIFAFGHSDVPDKRLVQHMLDLTPRETALLGELPTGECFAKLTGHPSWPHPFLMRVSS